MKRRIGIGITGLANVLMFLRQRYGSPQALETTELIMSTIRDACYRESIKLAWERGPFPAFDRDKYLKGQYVKSLPKDIQDGIAEYGIRNSHLNTVAPTGTGSIGQGDNCSGGLEPVYLARYKRKILQPDDSYREAIVEDFGFRVYANALFDGDWDRAMKDHPPYMVTTADLTSDDHLLTQAACQKYVDAAISKTINVPTETSYDKFAAIYDQAYNLGCKGCTTYRPDPDSGRGSVLSAVEETAISHPNVEPRIRERGEVLFGSTYKIRWGQLPYPMFFTINDEILSDGRHVPFECFLNSKSVDYSQWTTALTRMISAVMRKGGDLSFIPDELKAVWSARGGEWIGKQFVPSEVALIGMTLERHFREIGYITSEPGPVVSEQELEITAAHYAETGIGRECQSCGALRVIRSEGCDKCLGCGWSNCG
jgi:ribonucleoside-diphosphate reductase alpha chain